MTGKEKIIRALKHQPIKGHVPHFEFQFFLTMEKFGKIHPRYINLHKWGQMSVREKEMQLQYVADVYLETAGTYDYSAISVNFDVSVESQSDSNDAIHRLFEIIRERSGDQYFIIIPGDATYGIPNGSDMTEFSAHMYDEPEKMCEQAQRQVDQRLEDIRKLRAEGLIDGINLNSDYCFNTNSFFPPDIFSVLVAPYLKQLVDAYHSMGFYTIKHTDGNIMPIIDQIAASGTDGLQSIDPQGGVDLKTVKKLYGDKLCLMGNVNCGLLQTGTDEEVRQDVLRSLRDGMPGYGYIFSTSNVVYPGMPLQRYELMHSIWKEHGVYK
ncbi:MAG: hypothetical protein FWD78_03770 [Treponema sp.]|nr:hypothetical protein [Treponema sp.]